MNSFIVVAGLIAAQGQVVATEPVASAAVIQFEDGQPQLLRVGEAVNRDWRIESVDETGISLIAIRGDAAATLTVVVPIGDPLPELDAIVVTPPLQPMPVVLDLPDEQSSSAKFKRPPQTPSAAAKKSPQ